MRNVKRNFFLAPVAAVIILFCAAGAMAQAQKARTGEGNVTPPQQPLYTEYKGVHLGMTAQEARAKLGNPNLKSDDQDYYVFSENESAQLVYDAAHKIVTISIDFVNGVGAPDPKAIVGGELEKEANGSLYKLVRDQGRGLWVSYNRTAGPMSVVTITIQKQIVAY
jgi:outer membrane protein assembly factor BamE (lipoprotein component of BamABCDE complex)